MTPIAAIVLAAGKSERFGEANKLLSDFGGKPLLKHTLDIISQTPFSQKIVVTGHQADELRMLVDANLHLEVFNPDFAKGMGMSIAAGVKALSSNCEGAMIFLGDMPVISFELVMTLLGSFEPEKIVLPVFAGRYGHPILFAKRYFADLANLDGDQGGKIIINSHNHNLIPIAHSDDTIHFDIDIKSQTGDVQ